MKRDFEGCQKEFYSGLVTYKQYFYDGKLYYLNPRGICRSNEDGTEIELVVEMDLRNGYLDLTIDTPPEIMVNSTGIYFHKYDHNCDSEVRRYSFDGKLINEITLENVSKIYIYKTKIFYLSSYWLGDFNSKDKGYCIDIETGEEKQFCKQADDIYSLYGTDKYAVIEAKYKNKLRDDADTDGWYLFNFETEKYICLSSYKYPPHLILSHPEYFDYGSDEYVDIRDRLTYNIFHFDLTRDIMWVYDENGEPKPKTFLNGVNDIDGIPEWHNIPNYACFFNGEVLFKADSYYQYSAYDRDGNKHSYSSRDGHGYCNYFAIHNNILYMQIEAEYPEQYKIENGEITKLRNCWFKEEPKETAFGFTVWDDSNL